MSSATSIDNHTKNTSINTNINRSNAADTDADANDTSKATLTPTPTPISMISYDDRQYIDATSSLKFPGLFQNFHTAATLLRVARSELPYKLLLGDSDKAEADDDYAKGKLIVDDFYDLLQRVEENLNTCGNSNSNSNSNNTSGKQKLIVEVEGLDGSGKTSLVQSLQDALNGNRRNKPGNECENGTEDINTNTNTNGKINSNCVPVKAIKTKTPSPLLSDIRPLWDHRGGILARAFYYISNYVLQYEIDTGIIGKDADIIFIDRWYASTVAYTVAYHPDDEEKQSTSADAHINANANTGSEQIRVEDLPVDIFQWPRDLNLQPDLMLLLHIDPEVRQARIEHRKQMGGGASRFNPWDDRLANIPTLGGQIMTALKLVTMQGPVKTHTVDGNGSKQEVLEGALKVVRECLMQMKEPQRNNDPLIRWRYDAMRLGLGDEQGRRCRHALYNLQVSFANANKNGNSPPTLKTVGLNHIDSECIYYWSSSSSLDSSSTGTCIDTSTCRESPGSVLWCAGIYPLEFQWRAEGYLTKVTQQECQLMGFHPPPSLARHIKACEEFIAAKKKSNESENNERVERDDSYDDIVRTYSSSKKGQEKKQEQSSSSCSTISLWRFVPVRIEVLRGGPSTRIASYPERHEWTLNQNQNHTHERKWIMRSILPFSPTRINHKSFHLKKCTIALMGTHTSGKSTIGKHLSALLGWRFDEELGNILRNEKELVPNGHLHGNGSDNAQKDANENINPKSEEDDWDELILRKECERDGSSSPFSQQCRVVETWHGGNAAWRSLRCRETRNMPKPEFQQSAMFRTYVNAMSNHAEAASVLMIFLSLDSSNAILKRRDRDHSAPERLPFENETQDAEKLHGCLNDLEFYEDMAKEANIPLLVVDNTDDGEEGMERTLRSILDFVKKHFHRRVEMVKD